MHSPSAQPYPYAYARVRAWKCCLAAAAVLLTGAFPAGAGAAGPGTSGGASLTGGPAAGSQAAGSIKSPIAQAVNRTVSTSGNGFTLDATESAMTTHEITFSGVVPAADSGQTIELERAPSGAEAGATWTETAKAVVGADGAFSIPWRAAQGGQFEFRAVIATAQPHEPVPINDDTASGAAGLPSPMATTASQNSGGVGTAASPPLTVTIFKAALATIYGPGLYGHHTACGQLLRTTTIGVASRTLKCGTEVSVYYKGRELSVPVIDRGPYGSAAKWDLTMATARAIGVTTTSTIGTLS